MNNGTYEGVFVTFLSTDAYKYQNYVFRESSTGREACVQIGADKPLRMHAAYGAFILGQTVIIRVTPNHNLESIAIPLN